MKRQFLILTSVLALVPSGWCDYAEKPDTNTNYVAEPVLPAGTRSVQKIEGDYPYYGNAPQEMLPYRNLEPYYRYWLTRLPFRGPGREYPDAPDLKSLKVGLLSPPPYGPEAVRGDMSKKGVLLAFAEANTARPPCRCSSAQSSPV